MSIECNIIIVDIKIRFICMINGKIFHFMFHVSQNKRNCMNCFKCKDKYALTDEFYSNMCDSIAGCYDDPVDYITDNLPYTYAYRNTNFENECSPTTLNPIQKITCKVLESNPVLDTLTITTIPDTARCTAEIATLELPLGIGSLASAIL